VESALGGESAIENLQAAGERVAGCVYEHVGETPSNSSLEALRQELQDVRAQEEQAE
jgi:hypothetical protein